VELSSRFEATADAIVRKSAQLGKHIDRTNLIARIVVARHFGVPIDSLRNGDTLTVYGVSVRIHGVNVRANVDALHLLMNGPTECYSADMHVVVTLNGTSANIAGCCTPSFFWAQKRTVSVGPSSRWGIPLSALSDIELLRAFSLLADAEPAPPPLTGATPEPPPTVDIFGVPYP